jgi:hypothetical protein
MPPTPPGSAQFQNNLPMINEIKTALENIDWQYVTLSRLRYDDSITPVSFGNLHWLERPFAYEIYHQLRCLQKKTKFDMKCVIHAEVLKTYQEIRNLKKMPDLLIHVPDTERNLAVVEIKLASNTSKELRDDLDKLALFQRVLRYETLIEIVIGETNEFHLVHRVLDKVNADTGATINILFLSLDDHRIEHRSVKYREVNNVQA